MGDKTHFLLITNEYYIHVNIGKSALYRNFLSAATNAKWFSQLNYSLSLATD